MLGKTGVELSFCPVTLLVILICLFCLTNVGERALTAICLWIAEYVYLSDFSLCVADGRL